MLLVQRTVCCNATRQVYKVSVCNTKLSWCRTDTVTVCVYNRPGSVASVPAEWDFSARDWHFSAGAVFRDCVCIWGGGGVKMSLRQIHTKTG